MCRTGRRTLILNGAGGGSRTHTELPPPDFESGASANSTTPAINDFSINQLLRKCHSVSCSITKCQNCSHFASNLQAGSFSRLSTVTGSDSEKEAAARVQAIDAGSIPAFPLNSTFYRQSKTKAKPILFRLDKFGITR